MERGLYIAATGMLSAIAQQDTIASNLANVNTVGYKGDRVVNETFGDMFLTNMKNGRDVGQINMGTRVAGVITDFSQGSMRNTGNKLDVAIGGDGFFTVQQMDGTVAHTRNGQFARSAQGYLTTQRGDFVLSDTGQRILIGAGEPTFSEDGRVFSQEGDTIAQLGISTLDIPNSRKVGDNMWQGAVTGGQPGNTTLRQGFVEASGVNSVKEMIGMITTLRSYESSQKVLTSIDSTLDKSVNSIGNLG